MTLNIVVTVGPKSIDTKILSQLKDAGANDFRINLSHSSPQLLNHYIDNMTSVGITPSLDTQGAQLRVISISSKQTYNRGDKIYICFKMTDSNQNFDHPVIYFNHSEAASQVDIDDILRIDFSGLSILILSKVSEYLFECVVNSSGTVMPDRAADVIGKCLILNTLTRFDREAIQIAHDRNCLNRLYGSFISTLSDISTIRSVVPESCKIISKIETSTALTNIQDILLNSDEVLVDRGDLSREITIPMVPIATRRVQELSRQAQVNVNIATNILDSMMTSAVPSRAEISDIFNLLESGASGIVLAAEVAIGDNPVSSVSLLRHLSQIYESDSRGLRGIAKVEKPRIDLIGHELASWL